jgi:hypothetical protein
MTEMRPAYVAAYAAQLDLFGGTAPPADLSYQERVALVLERHPEARDNDGLLLYYYWLTFDGLDAVLPDEATRDRFRIFLEKHATSPETIRRRRQEIQKNRTGAGSLRPSPGEAKRRRALDGAGAPRRKR